MEHPWVVKLGQAHLRSTESRCLADIHAGQAQQVASSVTAILRVPEAKLTIRVVSPAEYRVKLTIRSNLHQDHAVRVATRGKLHKSAPTVLHWVRHSRLAAADYGRAELASPSCTPASKTISLLQHTRVLAATTEVHNLLVRVRKRDHRIENAPRGVPSVLLVAEAQLTDAAPSPADHADATCVHGAGVVKACSDTRCPPIVEAEVERHIGQHMHVLWHTPVGDSIATGQLPIPVVSPTPHHSKPQWLSLVLEDGTARRVAAVQLLHKMVGRAEVDVGQIDAHLIRIIASIDHVIVAQVAKHIGTPASGSLSGQDCTCVVVAAGQADSGAVLQVDIRQVVAHSTRTETTSQGVSIPELAVTILAPALHSATRPNHASVMPPQA